MSTTETSSPRTVKVVIVGAGISGSVLALALLRLAQTPSRSNTSLQLILVDAASTFRAVGAGFGLTANGIHPLRQLGLVDQLMQVSMPLHAIQQHKVVEKTGVKEGTLLMHSVVPERQWGEPVVVVERSAIQEMLGAELNKQGVRVRMKTRYAGADPAASGATDKLDVRFEDGTVESDIDFLVGADGVRSRVREQVQMDAAPKSPKKSSTTKVADNLPYFTGWTCVVGVSGPIDSEKAGKGTTHWIFPPSIKGGYGTWELPGRRQFWYIIEADEVSPNGPGAPIPVYDDASKKASLEKHKDEWLPYGTVSVLTESTPPERLVKIPMLARIYPRWVNAAGNIALLGDAAHPMTPWIGQGANVSMEDAIVLANAILPRQGEERGLAWYEKQRKERVDSIIKTGEFVGKLQMAETFLWRAARWVAFSALRFLVSADPDKIRPATDPNEAKNPMAWIQGMKVELEK